MNQFHSYVICKKIKSHFPPLFFLLNFVPFLISSLYRSVQSNIISKIYNHVSRLQPNHHISLVSPFLNYQAILLDLLSLHGPCSLTKCYDLHLSKLSDQDTPLLLALHVWPPGAVRLHRYWFWGWLWETQQVVCHITYSPTENHPYWHTPLRTFFLLFLNECFDTSDCLCQLPSWWQECPFVDNTEYPEYLRKH